MGNGILKFWSFLIRTLSNQRGEVGEGDELTDDERAIVGDEEEETEETEETEEKEDAEEKEESETKETEKEESEEAESDKDEPKVPQSRVDEIVSERKETQHKLDLLKTDPGAYYEKYPDEKPAEPAAATKDSDIGNLRVEGGEYDGKTVDEVLAIDQAAGTKLILAYYRTQDTELAEQKSTEATRLAESEAEINTFSDGVSSELFEKKAGDLDAKEKVKVEEVVQATLDFMKETGRGGGVIADAYYLMNRDSENAKARTDGAEKLINKLTTGAVASTSSSKDSGLDTGYAADMALSADELADKLDKMSDSVSSKYMKDAPKEMRDKYPHLPWD